MVRFANVGISLIVAIAAISNRDSAADEPAKKSAASELSLGEQLFVRRIRPLFKEKCLACHGEKPEELKGEFDLRSRAVMLKGGESGESALVPGKPDESPLYRAVARRDGASAMPPKENDKLTEQQIGWIRQWIEAGAPWSEANLTSGWTDEATDGVIVKTTAGRSPEWTHRRYQPDDLWAYRPIRLVEPLRNPLTRPLSLQSRGEGTEQTEAKAVHPVDAFIRERLTAKGLSRGAGAADRRTLIRRATFDLTGLPPDPDDVDAFVRDDSPDAYPKLVKRLLASPHYGEQQTRHWLDVVRYADTSGLSNDYERPHAWRYRDYVVRSFNADKPYDRFVVEQLAGDELLEERAGHTEDVNDGDTARKKKSPLTLALSPLGRG